MGIALACGACSPNETVKRLPGEEEPPVELLLTQANLPIEARGFAAVEPARFDDVNAYWSEILTAFGSAAEWPTRPTWRVVNHARYAKGGQSPLGDRLDRETEERRAATIAEQRRASGFKGLFAEVPSRYPFGPAHVEPGTPVPVPLVVLPSPRWVREKIDASMPAIAAELDSPERSGQPYSIHYAFPARRVDSASTAGEAIPVPERGESRGGGDPGLITTISPYRAGSVVVQSEGARQVEEVLANEGWNTRDVMRICTAEVADGAWLAHVAVPHAASSHAAGHQVSVQVGFPLLDAMGSPRAHRARVDARLGTWHENQVRWDGGLPSFDRHSTGIWPCPREAGAESIAIEDSAQPNRDRRIALLERLQVCATEAWLDAGPGLWIVERLPTSGPLTPDYFISRDLKRLSVARDSLVLVAVTADLDVELLVEVLAALTGQPKPQAERIEALERLRGRLVN